MNIFTCHAIGLMLGYILDIIIGDPHEMPHIIRLIGSYIAYVERKIYKNNRQQGFMLVTIVIASVTIVSVATCYICYSVSSIAYVVLDAVISFYCLATRSLIEESKKVVVSLSDRGILEARKSLSMIVGRDTESLDEHAVLRATVETIAENASDGVIAPMLYLSIGGPVLGLVYKAVNTMDSMIGYKNDRYYCFGYYAAKLDDVFNFLPSRIAAVISIGASALCGYDYKNALKIWQRDRLNHKSPNSAQTEAVYAGALNLRLAGGALYFGKWVEKPYIGDDTRKIEIDDVYRAHKILFVSSLISIVICVTQIISFM